MAPFSRKAERVGRIDPSARVTDGARLGADVEIGPYCVVGTDVELGDGVQLHPHVHVAGHTKIGPRTVVYPFASLGTPPQSVQYRGGPTRLVIGAENIIREHVTINTGTQDLLAAFQNLASGKSINGNGTACPLDWDPNGAVKGGTIDMWCIGKSGETPVFQSSGLVFDIKSQTYSGEYVQCGQ